MSAWRALVRTVRRGSQHVEAQPRFWGWIGPYEAVTRDGLLLLLAPDPVHPSLRATRPA